MGTAGEVAPGLRDDLQSRPIREVLAEGGVDDVREGLHEGEGRGGARSRTGGETTSDVEKSQPTFISTDHSMPAVTTHPTNLHAALSEA